MNPYISYPLNSGGCSPELPPVSPYTASGKTAPVGRHRYGVYLRSKTFGFSLDFSCEGSFAEIPFEPDTLPLNQDFTLSLWVKVRPCGTSDRSVLTLTGESADSLELTLDGSRCFTPVLRSQSLATARRAIYPITDGKWHLLAVIRREKAILLYADGRLVQENVIKGHFLSSETREAPAAVITLARNPEHSETAGLHGQLARLRFFTEALAPDAVDDTVIDPDDNRSHRPRLDLKKGICPDRRQYYQPVPFDWEGQTVTEDDIVNIINTGADHVKLLLTPNHLIREDGSLIAEALGYISEVIGYVKKHGFRCILCLHPELPYKQNYISRQEPFELLLRWYREFAEYIGAHWEPDLLAFQLMTEPGWNDPDVPWSYMSDRMWGTVRNVLPDHTLITSSDRWGNFERLKLMTPADDDNLIYSYTTYEPYTIGWYYYGSIDGGNGPWAYIHDIPYPVEAGVDYTDAIEFAMNELPEEWKPDMRRALKLYTDGIQDSIRADMPNIYPSLYNRHWHFLRGKSLEDWRCRYGGFVPVMCVEFGCMDALFPREKWKARPCYGISDACRLEFTADMRESFDAYHIGWDYWSYNEAHTLMKPKCHRSGESPAPERARKMFDYPLLTTGLGMEPLVSED